MYRCEIVCFKCGKTYVTRLISHGRPNKCKYCGSTMINVLKKWRF